MDSREQTPQNEANPLTPELSEQEVVDIIIRARSRQEVAQAIMVQQDFLACHPKSQRVILAGEQLHMLAEAYNRLTK